MKTIAGLAALVLMLVSAGTAQAADHWFCRDYTRAAMRQVNLALSIPRCARRLPGGSRWSADPHVHFEWCRDASPWAADRERRARRIFLDRCRSW
jgi:hypothetical protein